MNQNKELQTKSSLPWQPEQSKTKQKISRRAIAGLTAAGLALAGAGAAYGLNEHSSVNSLQQTISTLKKNERVGSAADLATAEAAARQATVLTEELNSGQTAKMRILNGVLDYVGPYPKDFPSIEAPILLATDSILNPDSKADYLSGSWLGSITVSPNGQIIVDALPYQQSDYKFAPYDQSNPVLIVDAYAQASKAAPGLDILAYQSGPDQTLTNPNGSVLEPGLNLSNP